MIEIDKKENRSNYIFDVTEKDFIEKVIEASSNKLIIVDFWAPWCEPCKQLGPILENVVSKCNNKVALAKINIDENQQIATQLRIQSIPAVFAFKNKKIASAFQGVIPENQIIEFIEKILGEKLEKDNSDFFIEINKLLNEQSFKEALELLESFIFENSNDKRGIKHYLECLLGLSKFEEAKSFISSLSDEIQKTTEVKSIIAQIGLKENAIKGPSLSKIESKYEKNPKNLNLVIELSEKYFTSNMLEKSFELLLDQYSQNNEKNKEKIKKILLKYFDALGDENENTKYYRKKFSSIMFA